MKKTINRVITIFGMVLILAGVILPPRAVVGRVLPAEGAGYADLLVQGLWCLKVALTLNGLLLLGRRWLRRLWLRAGDAFPDVPRSVAQSAGMGPMDVLVACALFLAALLLRGINLSQSLIADEVAIQEMFIDRGLPVILTYMPFMPQHVLYSVMAYVTEFLPLPLEITYRLPAVVFGSSAVVLFYLLCRRYFPRLESAVAAGLALLSPFGIVHAQMAKSYTLTQFAFLLAVISQLWVMTQPRRLAGWLGFGAALTLLVSGHLYNVYLAAGLVLGFCLLAVVKLRPARLLQSWGLRLTVTLGLCGAVLFLFYAMQIPQILALAQEVQLQPEERMSRGFFQGWLMQITFWRAVGPMAVLSLAIAVMGLVALTRRAPELVMAGGLPLGALLAMVAVKNSFIYPRYLVFTLFLFLLGYIETGCLVGRVAKRRWVGIVALFFLAVGFGVPAGMALGRYYATGNQDLRGAVQVAENAAQPGRPILAYGLCHDQFPYLGARVEGIATFRELKRRMTTGPYPVYLLVAYPTVLANKPEEMKFIRDHFRVLWWAPGMLMDSNRRVGDVYVYISRQEYRKSTH